MESNNKILIFDTHAHYNDRAFVQDLDEIIRLVFEPEGYVECAINAGTNLITSHECIELAEKYPCFYATVGIHPSDCGELVNEAGIAISVEEAESELEKMLEHPKVIAIGEIGLDYHYDDPPKEIQLEWFDRQMKLAEKTGYPVVIHDREAHGACLEIVKKHPAVRGVFHSYSGSAEMAKELLNLGYYISFSGVITFKNAQKALEAVKIVPIDRMFIETDCPYLTPHPFRGKRNHSGYTIYTAEKAAELKDVSFEELCSCTAANAKNFFGI